MAKRFMALLLALLLLLSLSACASAPAGSVESPSHSPRRCCRAAVPPVVALRCFPFGIELIT